MKFSLQQINELLEIINRFHVLFIAEQLGVDTLSTDDKRILINSGVNISKLRREGKIDDAFKFGILVDAIRASKAKQLSYNDFKKFLGSGKFLPLTEVEQLALNSVKLQAYSDIKGLGNRIGKDFTNVVIEGDRKQRKKFEKIIKEESEQAILDRKTISELSSALKKRTKDYARDFDRIADYIMHSAYDLGKAEAIKNRAGSDSYVYKVVYPQACEKCQEAYLTNGIGSRPIVFKLSTLLDNGTNIGRKSDEMKPVCGPHHPFCRCELEDLPENSEWNQEKQSFVLKRNTKGIERKVKIKPIISYE